MSHSAAFHPEARAEFRAAVARYERERPGLGITFAGRVREVVHRAAEQPLTGAPYTLPDVRRLFVRDFRIRSCFLSRAAAFSLSPSPTSGGGLATGPNASTHRRGRHNDGWC